MYQLLEVGDIIRNGDEHLSSVSGKWEDVSWYSGSVYKDEDFYLVRRKIKGIVELGTTDSTGSPKLPECGTFVDIADDHGISEGTAIRLYNWFVRQLRAGA